MPRILAPCPTTGQSVPTGYRSADLDLEAPDGAWSFRCTACQQVHAWTAQDATVETTPQYVA